MKRSIMHSQQIAVELSLNVYRTSDQSDKVQFSVLPILSLTRFLMWLWQAQQQVNRVSFYLRMTIQNLVNIADIQVIVFKIALSSLVWGLR